MHIDTTISRVPATPAPEQDPKRERALAVPPPHADEILLGARYWRSRVDDELTVRLLVVPRNRIAVDLWWNRRNGPADVTLVFGLYASAAELGMLTGNGFDAPRFHRAGFGTLAVNVGVQALQSTCAPQTAVHGLLSNTAEEPLEAVQREPLEAARRAFWRRFGLQVRAAGLPPLDYLHGTVGALRVVPHGQIAGQFARDLKLADFSVIPPDGF
jgi:hypothetical protein